MAINNDSIRRIAEYYEHFDESERLSDRLGQLEFIRTQEIIRRHLFHPPAVVLDIGGASGIYSCWLAKEGYEVHLVDPVPSLVEKAKEASQNQSDTPLASCQVGDARTLPFPDMTADAVLLFGPLYHLIHRTDRMQALSEVYRSLKMGGLLFAVGISRFASAIDALGREFIKDPAFMKIVDQDMRNGHHRNPTHNLSYFTDAYFHRPEELQSEIEESGYEKIEMVAIEGLGYVLRNFKKNWNDDTLRESFLDLLRRLEVEPSLLGASPHIMSITRKI